MADLDRLDWPESIKLMQRNWIGRSEGAEVRVPHRRSDPIAVFTTRPDTLFGATYMVLAPEHPLVDELVADAGPTAPTRGGPAARPRPTEAVEAYRIAASRKSELDRQTAEREKTGVFIGAYRHQPGQRRAASRCSSPTTC